MKCLIVNANSFQHKDKHTGEVLDAIGLGVVGKNLSNSSGKCVMNLYVGKKTQLSLYNILMASCNGDTSNFNNTLVDIEFDNRKNIVGFEAVKADKDNPAVIWGF